MSDAAAAAQVPEGMEVDAIDPAPPQDEGSDDGGGTGTGEGAAAPPTNDQAVGANATAAGLHALLLSAATTRAILGTAAREDQDLNIIVPTAVAGLVVVTVLDAIGTPGQLVAAIGDMVRPSVKTQLHTFYEHLVLPRRVSADDGGLTLIDYKHRAQVNALLALGSGMPPQPLSGAEPGGRVAKDKCVATAAQAADRRRPVKLYVERAAADGGDGTAAARVAKAAGDVWCGVRIYPAAVTNELVESILNALKGTGTLPADTFLQGDVTAAANAPALPQLASHVATAVRNLLTQVKADLFVDATYTLGITQGAPPDGLPAAAVHVAFAIAPQPRIALWARTHASIPHPAPLLLAAFRTWLRPVPDEHGADGAPPPTPHANSLGPPSDTSGSPSVGGIPPEPANLGVTLPGGTTAADLIKEWITDFNVANGLAPERSWQWTWMDFLQQGMPPFRLVPAALDKLVAAVLAKAVPTNYDLGKLWATCRDLKQQLDTARSRSREVHNLNHVISERYAVVKERNADLSQVFQDLVERSLVNHQDDDEDLASQLGTCQQAVLLLNQTRDENMHRIEELEKQQRSHDGPSWQRRRRRCRWRRRCGSNRRRRGLCT